MNDICRLNMCHISELHSEEPKNSRNLLMLKYNIGVGAEIFRDIQNKI